jgi:LPXTG-motif cell wall-anchored protein
LLFGEHFTLWTLLGAAVIVGGASWLVLSRREAVTMEE